MKHIILGDPHIGRSISIGKPGVGKELNSRIKDQLGLLDWVLTLGGEHLIITGDVYHDPRPHPALINLFMGWLKKCEKLNVSVDIIAGNHDILRTGNYILSALDLIAAVEFPHARVFKNPAAVDFEDIRFSYVPYRDKRMYEADSTEKALECLAKELEFIKQNPEKRNIMVGHMALDGALNITDEISDALNEIFVPTELLGWPEIIMGHIHHPQKIGNARHIGSMDRSDFHIAETDTDKIIYIIDGETTEKRVIPTRSLCRVEVDIPPGHESTDYTIQAINLYNKTKSLKDAIVRLEIVLNGDGIANVDRVKINSFLYDNIGVYYICGFYETRNLSVINLDEEKIIDQSMTVPMAIESFADSRKDFDDEEERQGFKTLALEINQQYREGVKV